MFAICLILFLSFLKLFVYFCCIYKTNVFLLTSFSSASVRYLCVGGCSNSGALNACVQSRDAATPPKMGPAQQIQIMRKNKKTIHTVFFLHKHSRSHQREKVITTNRYCFHLKIRFIMRFLVQTGPAPSTNTNFRCMA